VVVDLAVVAVVAFPTAMDAWWNTAGSRQADGWTYALLVVQLLALVVRRRAPRAASLVCGLALTGWYVAGHHGEALNLPTMVALYTVAVQGDRRTTVATGVVAAAWSGGLAELAGNPVGSPVLEMAWPAVPLLLGEVVRGRRELLAAAVERAERAEADREREGRRRADEERLRIARELHDVVAHTLVAVNVHMNVASQAFGSHPDAAERAIAQARASSKEALAELRAAVAVLREGPEGAGEAPPAPAPGLDRLGDLVAGARRAGLAVTLDDTPVGGQPVPAVVGLAAYRIVQEALANVVRHAGATAASVTLTREPGAGAGAGTEALVVEVRDDGTGPPPPPPPDDDTAATAAPVAGHGLVGMAERAAVLGGTLRHGPGPAGRGFVVRATLPTGVPA
jgi:signal transduction histidine kinase